MSYCVIDLELLIRLIAHSTYCIDGSDLVRDRLITDSLVTISFSIGSHHGPDPYYLGVFSFTIKDR